MGALDERARGETERTGARDMGVYFGVVAVVLALDILTKAIVQRTLVPYQTVPVFGDVFRFTYIFNRGAAFGLHLGDYSRFIFIGLTIAIVAMLFFWYRDTPADDRLRRVSIALVTGGAIGNFIDRVRSSRGVVDFLDVGFGSLRWPVFNIADIAVTTGAILLAVCLWREEHDAEPDDR